MKSFSFRKVSIRHELRALMLLTATASLLLACAAFVFLDFKTFRAGLVRDTETLAGVIASNESAPLTFGDHEAAREILSALKEKPAVEVACIFSTNGAPFATYVAAGKRFQPRTLDQISRNPRRGDVEVFHDIVLDGHKLGTLYVASSAHDVVVRAKRYFFVAAIILLVSLLFAFLLSLGLHRLISTPIMNLANVANEVTRSRNFATRVDLANDAPHDEISRLISSFNEMLAEIERRDDQLKRHRDDLERQVEFRTSELRAANMQLRAARDMAEMAAESNGSTLRRKQLILNSAAEGIFGLDSEGVVTF